jgi:hypothetical protein
MGRILGSKYKISIDLGPGSSPRGSIGGSTGRSTGGSPGGSPRGSPGGPLGGPQRGVAGREESRQNRGSPEDKCFLLLLARGQSSPKSAEDVAIGDLRTCLLKSEVKKALQSW